MTTPESPSFDEEWARACARRLIHNPATIDDIVQEVWLVSSKADVAPEAFRSWVRTCTLNITRKLLRSDRRRATREKKASHASEVFHDSDPLESEEQQRLVLQSVLSLSPVLREAIILRYYEGLTPARIAKQFSISVDTVKARLKRALAQLRARLSSLLNGSKALLASEDQWAGDDQYMYDQVFRHVLESHNHELTERRLLEDPLIPRTMNIGSVFRAVRNSIGAPVTDLLNQLRNEPTEVGRSVILFFWAHQVRLVAYADYEALHRELPRLFRDSETEVAVTNINRYYELRNASTWCEFVDSTESVIEKLAEIPGTRAKALKAIYQLHAGTALLSVGTMDRAHAHIANARRLCDEDRFFISIRATLSLGEYYREMGDHETAFKVHCDPVRRELARELERYSYLCWSHTCAAQAALDGSHLDTAAEELAAARECLIGPNPAAVGRWRVALLFTVASHLSWARNERETAEHELSIAERLYFDDSQAIGSYNVQTLRGKYAIADHNSQELAQVIRSILEHVKLTDFIPAQVRHHFVDFSRQFGTHGKFKEDMGIDMRLVLIHSPSALRRCILDLAGRLCDSQSQVSMREFEVLVRDAHPAMLESCDEDYRERKMGDLTQEQLSLLSRNFDLET